MTNNYNLTTTLTGNTTLQSNIIPNNNVKKEEDDLPRLGRRKSSGIRKSVSFNNNISVTKVENWKKYNKDVSEETEFFKLKKQIQEFKAQQAKKLKEQNDCCCIIF